MNTTIEVATCPTCDGQKTVAVRLGGESPKVQFPACPECVTLPKLKKIRDTLQDQLGDLTELPHASSRAVAKGRLRDAVQWLDADLQHLADNIAAAKAAKAAQPAHV